MRVAFTAAILRKRPVVHSAFRSMTAIKVMLVGFMVQDGDTGHMSHRGRSNADRGPEPHLQETLS